LEDVEDILFDLDQALMVATGKARAWHNKSQLL
jgi:hypothetical protein